MSSKKTMAAPNTDAALIRHRLLGARQPVCILSHPYPDGDSVGSAIGLWGILTAAGITAQTVFDSVPRVYEFLTTRAEIYRPPLDLEGKIAVVLDCSTRARLQEVGLSLAGAALIVNIDHHRGNEYFGHLNYVDCQAAAVGEIIHRIFGVCPQYYSPEVAEALFTAIFTDTGRFSYGNTTADSLQTAATLVEYGASPQRIYNFLYQNRSPVYLAFLGQALTRIQLHFSGQLALLPLERDLLLAHGLEDWELEEINDYPRSLAGVKVSVVLREIGQGKVKASLRSKGLDVAAIARGFGGGGHRNAAGVTLTLPLAEVMGQFLQYFEGERVF